MLFSLATSAIVGLLEPIICRSSTFTPILIENDEVVVLGHVRLQPEVLRAERYELIAGSIISQLVWSHSFDAQHEFKESSAMTTSLNRFVSVEVKDAYGFDLFDASSIVDEQVSSARFYKPNDSISLRAYEHFIIGRKEFR